MIMKTEIKRKLGLNIKFARIRSGYTQEEIAEIANVSLSHVSKIEQGLTSPTAYLLYKFSKAIDIPMDNFFQGF